MSSKRQVLVIGERPSSTEAGARGVPLSGPSLNRLVDLADGLVLRTRNLMPWAPVPGEPKWCRREARNYAQAMWPALAGREVILLGRQVARAFGHVSPWTDKLARADWFSLSTPTIRSHAGRWKIGMVWIAPHPSGRNRWWNDADNQHMGGVFWSQVAGRTEFPITPVLPMPVRGIVRRIAS